MESSQSCLRVFTVGHSNHALAHFLELLQTYAVEVVVDVRSQPYSKYARHFDQGALRAALVDAGVRYLYLGRELGGRPEGNEFYDAEGHVLYDRVAATRLFHEGVARLERGLREFRVALLCAEENPAFCHRRLLVTRVLVERGIQVEHIRGDGRVQSEPELAAELGTAQEQLALFRAGEADQWKSSSPIVGRKRLRHEAPSEPASS